MAGFVEAAAELRSLLGDLPVDRVDAVGPRTGPAAAALEQACAQGGWAAWWTAAPAGAPSRLVVSTRDALGRSAAGARLWVAPGGEPLGASLCGVPFRDLAARLAEHGRGRLPLVLAPEQVRVLPVGRGQRAFGAEVVRRLAASGGRAVLGGDAGPLAGRVAAAWRDRIPWTVVVGGREASRDEAALRVPGRGTVTLTLDALCAALRRATGRDPQAGPGGRRTAVEVTADALMHP